MSELRGPLETIYDEEISPLMQQILDISKRHNLPMFATFALDGNMTCDSLNAPAVNEVPEEDREGYAHWRRVATKAASELSGDPAIFAYTITTMRP